MDIINGEKDILVKFYCDGGEVELTDETTISKRDISVIFGILDCVIMIIFIYMVYVLKFSRKKAI